MIIGIFALIWVKNVNSVRAAVNVGTDAASAQRGDFQATLAALDRAIELAPDVSSYYNYKAQVYLAYQARSQVLLEEECSQEENYQQCLAFQAYLTSLEGSQRRPFYYRSHFTLANAAYNLGGTKLVLSSGDSANQGSNIKLREETVRLYRETLALVPGSVRIRAELADAYLLAGQPDAALIVLDESLAITGASNAKGEVYVMRGRAYRQLGDSEKAAQSLEQYLRLSLSDESRPEVDAILGETYVALEKWGLAAAAFLRLGNTYQESGKLRESMEALQRAADAYEKLGRREPAAEVWFLLGMIRLDHGHTGDSAEAFERNLALLPEGPLAQDSHRMLAQVYFSMGRLDLAAIHSGLADR